MRPLVVGLAILLVLAVARPTCAFAQSGTGAIVGIVKDPAGIPVPGVQVSVANESTGVTVEAVTNGEGRIASARSCQACIA